MPNDGWDKILDDDETILWQGRPDGRIVFSDLFKSENLFALLPVAFGIGFYLFAQNMFANFGGRNGPPEIIATLFPLFGLLFAGIGVWQIVGPVFRDTMARRSMHYTLTNKAAYTGKTQGGRSLKRVELTPDMELSLEDGSPGSVRFGTTSTVSVPGRGPSLSFNAGHHRPGFSSFQNRGPGISLNFGSKGGTRQVFDGNSFRMIEDARGVYRILRDAIEDLKPEAQ